ncbi:rCG58822 [Rattus norvegicus]|uniref:RCG58822 n=1 Tax=Rattus norvegicus TaxID=10116 RepID=A6JL44_RAT|nr:rCG58822 [Rattus norvegicus]
MAGKKLSWKSGVDSSPPCAERPKHLFISALLRLTHSSQSQAYVTSWEGWGYSSHYLLIPE